MHQVSALFLPLFNDTLFFKRPAAILSCRQAFYFAREMFDARAELKTSVAVRREEIVAEVNFS